MSARNRDPFGRFARNQGRSVNVGMRRKFYPSLSARRACTMKMMGARLPSPRAALAVITGLNF